MLFGQHPVERARLRDRAREAIEDEAVAAVGLDDPLGDDADDDLVGDEPTGVHDSLGLQTDRRFRSNGGAQHVTCR